MCLNFVYGSDGNLWRLLLVWSWPWAQEPVAAWLLITALARLWLYSNAKCASLDILMLSPAKLRGPLTCLSEDDATSWCISTSRASTHGHYGHVMAHQTTSIAPIWAAYWWSPQSRYFVWNCAKNLASHEWASVRLCSYCWEMTCVIMTWMRCVIMTWMRCHLCQVVAEQWGISWKIRAQSSSTWTLSGDPESGHCIR